MSTAIQHRARGAWDSVRHPVVAVGLGLVALQLVFRAWALYPSWFYADDYRLLYDASHSDLSIDYLTRPFDSQFMPGGRYVAWAVAESGHVNWAMAASITLVLQLFASVACLWMLTTLFGSRWGILAPLLVYLTSAILMPAFMWWAATLNQLPWQIAFFAAMSAWVRYLRSRRLRWLMGTAAFLSMGMLFYVKTLLILGVLIFVALAYFGHGSIADRVKMVVRSYWQAAVVIGGLSTTFVLYYATQIPQPFTDEAQSNDLAGSLASTMLGTSFATGSVGGPWRWAVLNPPVATANPPLWTVSLSWVILTVTVLYLLLRRERTGRAVVLVVGYAGVAFLLLLTSRAQLVGSFIGTEYRYLTDVAAVLVLGLGLASMRVRGAVESSTVRVQPLILVRVPAVTAPVLVLLVATSGAVSSAHYVGIWHGQNPGSEYVSNLKEAAAREGAVDVADQTVPDSVIPRFFGPIATTARLLPLVSGSFRFPESTPRLATVADDGTLRAALIDRVAVSKPGPIDDCGWKVTSHHQVTIPLNDAVYARDWWVRIGYLASSESGVTVRAGDREVETEVEGGVHSLYVKLSGSYDAVTIGGLDPGVTMCIDVIEVGVPAAGGVL